MKRTYLFVLMAVCAILSRGQTSILSLKNITTTFVQQEMKVQCDTIIPLNYSEPISGLSVSGMAMLHHAHNSLVRITLEDDYGTEYLVYELYPLLADSLSMPFYNVAYESSTLENIKVKSLNIKLVNATIELNKIDISTLPISSFAVRQSQTLNTQSSYIIDKLNNNLRERNIPWRAGETSISQLTYEEKKAMFGGEVPNLGGYEYYKGGIFVMPNYESQIMSNSAASMSVVRTTSPFVKEWDWRNRHGKNWMTSVKNQGICNSCWAFSSIGLLEAYSNLYYNQLLDDLDLSEQELVSCARIQPGSNNGCDPNDAANALEYIKSYGVMHENDFYYQARPVECEAKPSHPSGRVQIEDFEQIIGMEYASDDELKDSLLKSPLIACVRSHLHYITIVGYKELQVGDTVCAELDGDTIIIGQNNSFGGGTTAWILKNSYGDSFGENGYSYVVGDLYSFYAFYKIRGPITSSNYTDSNIIVEDADNDGYYFWGIGNRPSSLPAWAPILPDGDDSNPDYGPIDQYGHLQEISLTEFELSNTTTWSEDNYIYNNIVIKDGGSLTITADIMMYKDATITVESGGRLVVEGGSIGQADIMLKSGAVMNITQNGKVHLKANDSFVAETGANVLIQQGTIAPN